MNSSEVISKATVHRIVHDVKDILTDSLKSNGIFYKHDENDMLKGYALIIGPVDTPYQYGCYLFEVHFPKDYPHSPLKFIFMNRDKHNTRFHPNLYRNGKCCLSVLNTWVGEPWSSCQSLKSILLTLLTIFTKDPLLHEPGITTSHRDFNTYNKVITYRNIEHNIFQCIDKCKSENDTIYSKFKDIIVEEFKKHKKDIVNIVHQNMNVHLNYMVTIYNMRGQCNYKDLNDTFKQYLK